MPVERAERAKTEFGDGGLRGVERTAEQSASIEDIRRQVVGGCSVEEFSSLRCPMCGAGLRVDLHPRPGGSAFVFVACVASTEHMGFTDRAAVAPGWWSAHRSGGWITE
jgi:hypothetical protein